MTAPLSGSPAAAAPSEGVSATPGQPIDDVSAAASQADAAAAALDAEAPDAAAQVLRRFRIVFNAVKTHFQQVEKRAGVGGAQLWAMSLIGQQPGIGVGSLAQQMDVHQSTASNLIRVLVERGLVETQRSAQDRRAVHLHLKPDGQAVLDRAPGPFAGVLPQALQRLDPATLARMEQDLNTLIRELGTDEAAGGIPLAHL